MERIKKQIIHSSMLSAAGILLSAVFGYLLSGTKVAGIASFADISLCGGLSLPHSAAVLTGSLINCITHRTVGRNIVKISSMLMITAAKMFIEPVSSPKACGISTSASVIVSGAAVSALIGELPYKLMFYAFYGAVSGAAAFSAAMIADSLRSRKAVDMTSPCGCAYAIVYTLTISALCSLNTPGLNIGLIAGTAVTLAGAYFYRSSGGVLCGALTTCGAFLSSASCGMTVVLLPAAGLITGYMYQKKPAAAAGIFFGLSMMLMVLTGMDMNTVSAMADLLCGTGIFLMAAPYYSDKWVIVSDEDETAMPEILSSRMSFLSDSIGAVRLESERIAKMFSEKDSREEVVVRNSEEVCKRCCRRLACWKNEHDNTVRGFRKLACQGEFSAEEFPFELSSCLRKDALKESFRKSAGERTAMKLLSMRYAESRRLLSEQLKITEEMISSAGERLDVRYSAAVSRTIREKLAKFGISPTNVIAYYNSGNRLLAELYFPVRSAPESLSRICDLVSDELRIPLDAAPPVHSGREIRIRLFEKPAYSIQVCGAATCADGAKESGDTSMTFSDGTGAAYVILSDGMGSGRNAAVESKLVVRMFRKLITCGADYNSAIRLINSIMVTKSGEESFATLDAVRIDLDNCGLTVIKSGAAATLIRHRGNVIRISQSTFPIGIYEQSETFSKSFSLDEGDMIITFSDGINENEYRFIRELLLSENDLKHMVSEICRKAQVFTPGEKSDDVTVIGISVTRS